MDTQSNTTRSRTAPDGAPPIRTSLDDLGELYGLEFSGNDFAPEFRDGDILHFSTTERPKPGDIVAVWVRPEFLEPGRPQVTIWRLTIGWQTGMTFPVTFHPDSTAIPVVIIENAKGRKRDVRCDRILGIHKNTAVIFARQQLEAVQ